MKNWIFFLLFISLSQLSWAKQKRVFDLKESVISLQQEEVQKFKSFKKQLKQKQLKERYYLDEIRNYSKDSLRILAVKLLAVKELHKSGLLKKDISLNPDYYFQFLQKLKDSDIQNEEYSFLQQQLLDYKITYTEDKLNFSRGLNYIFIISLFILGYFAFKKKKVPPTPILSQQELKIKNHILEGKTNKEIADALFVSVNTVKTHITNIYHKLSVSNRSELRHKYQNSTGTSS